MRAEARRARRRRGSGQHGVAHAAIERGRGLRGSSARARSRCASGTTRRSRRRTARTARAGCAAGRARRTGRAPRARRSGRTSGTRGWSSSVAISAPSSGSNGRPVKLRARSRATRRARASARAAAAPRSTPSSAGSPPRRPARSSRGSNDSAGCATQVMLGCAAARGASDLEHGRRRLERVEPSRLAPRAPASGRPIRSPARARAPVRGGAARKISNTSSGYGGRAR